MSKKSFPSNCCPVFYFHRGTEFASVLSLNKLTANHPFFASNSVLRGSMNSFFHLTAKNNHHNSVISHEVGSSSGDKLRKHFSHSKLFADACLLSRRLEHAVVYNTFAHLRSRDECCRITNTNPTFPGEQENGAANVAIHISPGYNFCVALLAVWLAKCRAVPLNVHATDPEIDHVLNESQTRIVVTEPCEATNSSEVKKQQQQSSRPFLESIPHHELTVPNYPLIMVLPIVDFASSSEQSLTAAHRHALWKILQNELNDPLHPLDDAVAIATSGTTGKPKIAIHSHHSISNQTNVLLNAWNWTANDTLLHTLPLHHVHGLVNGVCCGIAASAHLEFLPRKFDPAKVVERLESGDITRFFSVPAAYKKILSYLESREDKDLFRQRLSQQTPMNLFVSGSSALPVPVLQQFNEMSGFTMLERYGMTELGMVLSQPLQPASHRIPGTVGTPLPGVEIRLVEAKHDDRNDLKSSEMPEHEKTYDLYVKSESMFSRYWGREDKTRESFVSLDDDGDENDLWFDTGDCVRIVTTSEGKQSFSIQGRASVDILKVSGFKISAVEIESALLDTGLLEECAVFAASSKNLTQDSTIVALITPTQKQKSIKTEEETVKELKAIMEKNLSHYKLPKKYIWAEHGIERNAMGKINKKHLAVKYMLIN